MKLEHIATNLGINEKALKMWLSRNSLDTSNPVKQDVLLAQLRNISGERANAIVAILESVPQAEHATATRDTSRNIAEHDVTQAEHLRNIEPETPPETATDSEDVPQAQTSQLIENQSSHTSTTQTPHVFETVVEDVPDVPQVTHTPEPDTHTYRTRTTITDLASVYVPQNDDTETTTEQDFGTTAHTKNNDVEDVPQTENVMEHNGTPTEHNATETAQDATPNKKRVNKMPLALFCFSLFFINALVIVPKNYGEKWETMIGAWLICAIVPYIEFRYSAILLEIENVRSMRDFLSFLSNEWVALAVLIPAMLFQASDVYELAEKVLKAEGWRQLMPYFIAFSYQFYGLLETVNLESPTSKS